MEPTVILDTIRPIVCGENTLLKYLISVRHRVMTTRP